MSDLIGKTLGPYRIVQQIGLGGMATVYKAFQPSMDRYVALKVLSTHLSQDSTFIKRFRQEAKVIAGLEHLHILPVYDHGEQEGYLYLVMRFIQAGTLKDRLGRDPLSLDEAGRIVAQVGSALEYAHQLGVVHRDLKPSNILVDPQGDCYLTDFGIAKMVEGTLGLTGSGVLGTPHYMAPEQSQSLKVDHRADVYAMGVVIYEMVTGRLPFDAETPFAVAMKHITEPLPLPRSIRPDLPEGVERVILRALAKDPADRYQSMRDLVAAFCRAVEAAASEVPTTAAPPAAPPMPTIIEEEEVEPTAVVRGPAPVPAPAWQRIVQQPLLLLAAAGLALVVLVLAGVILSRIPGRVEISGGQVQVVLPTDTAAPISRATSTPESPSPTPEPTPPAGPERLVFIHQCEGVVPWQICIRDEESGEVFQVTHDLDFGQSGAFAWSPDGEQIAFNAGSGPDVAGHYDHDLYVIDADGSGLRRITQGETSDRDLSWSPDGEWIAFHRDCGLWLVYPDGSGARELLPGSDDFCVGSPSWSPDSQRITFVDLYTEDDIHEIWVVGHDGNDPHVVYAFQKVVDWVAPAWSPDGSQVACIYGGEDWSGGLVFDPEGGQPEWLEEDKLPWRWLPAHRLWVGDWAAAGALHTSRPTPPAPSSPEMTGLEWEQIYDGEIFLRVGLNALAVDPHDPDTIFAGTYGAGIYVSRDGGRTWSPSNARLGKGTVSRLAVDPNDSNVVYAALFDQGGVYKSTDGGRTWEAASLGINLDQGWDWAALISIDPSDSQRLYYAGATEGFYLSMNGGQRWTRQRGDCPQVMDFVVDPADAKHIYAANAQYSGPDCPTGVFESTDGGQIWELLTSADMATADEFGGESWHVAADPRDFGILYAGSHMATYKSTDKGRTWTQIRDDGCDWLATNPSHGALYCAQGSVLQISRDGGGAWSAADLGGWGRWNSYSFAIAPDNPDTLYSGSDAVMKSSDGGETWLRIGWLGAARMRLTVDPRDGDRLFLGGVDSPCDVYSSQDAGRNWQVIAPNAGGCSVALDPDQGVLYHTSRSQGLFRSKDDGQTWEQFGSGYRDTWQLVPDPQDSRKIWATAGCGARPFLSKDGGATFAEIESFPEAICGDPILLAHPDGARVYVESNGVVYRSDDSGATWRRMGELGGMYRAATLDPSNPGVVYFGSTHKGVFKTTNGGHTWFEANAGLTAPAINELAVDPGNPQTVYAATDGGTFVSLDGGEGWQPINAGLGPNPIVYSVAVDPNDSSKVYAATPDGIFRLAGTTPEASAAPILTPMGRIVYSDGKTGNDEIYVANSDGSDEQRLTDHPAIDEAPAWSPDGTRIVFTSNRDATHLEDLQLYLINADGSNLIRLTTRADRNAKSASWSPDGSRITFHSYCDLMVVDADGSNWIMLVERREDLCPDFPTWAHDGRRIAFRNMTLPHDAPPVQHDIYVVNEDGSGLLKLATLTSEDWSQHVVWSPDGSQVAFDILVDGQERYYTVNSDGSGGLVEISSIPDSWYPWYWPQWTSEVRAAELPLAEQARAFAEPILAAIADRPPDFEDDFSDPTSGWERGILVDQTGWEEGERGYVDGEYYIVAPPAKPRPQHTDAPITCASGFLIDRQPLSDVVLEVEGRFVAVEDGNWHINLRQWHDPNTAVGGKHEVMAFPDGSVQISSATSDGAPVLMAQLQGPPMQPGLETNRLQIVAVGPQIALYVNGEPALFATDHYFDERYGSGLFSLVVCNLGDTPLEASWDNLRIWDISDLPLASAEAAAPTPTPTTASVKVDMWSDVWCWLQGPAGELASRNPHTGLDVVLQESNAVRDVAQIVVEAPNGEIVVVPPYGDIPYGEEGRFSRLLQGLPQAGGTYNFTALDADGTPIPGMVTSDLYLGGYEPDPVTNVQAEVVEAGILVNWDPAPIISGAFEPDGSPPLGFYSIYVIREEGEILYAWSHGDRPLPETSHLIPVRRQGFGQGDAGLALEEMDDGVYDLELHTFSVEPVSRAGQHAECIAHDPAENIRIVIEGGQMRVEKP